MTEKHLDVIRYLRSGHVDNAGKKSNERTIMKDMGKIWGSKPSSKDMYALFPGTPGKQGRKLLACQKVRARVDIKSPSDLRKYTTAIID